jgi:hypothetical protein
MFPGSSFLFHEFLNISRFFYYFPGVSLVFSVSSLSLSFYIHSLSLSLFQRNFYIAVLKTNFLFHPSIFKLFLFMCVQLS